MVVAFLLIGTINALDKQLMITSYCILIMRSDIKDKKMETFNLSDTSELQKFDHDNIGEG